jgi:hypothetical protein
VSCVQDVLLVSLGSKPWEPSPSTHVEQILEQRKHPLTGLLAVDDRTILFTRFDKAEAKWAYAEISVAERWALVSAPGPQAFGAMLDRLMSNRPVTLVKAPNNKIESVETIRGGPSLMRTAKAFRRATSKSKDVQAEHAGAVIVASAGR